MLDALWEEHRTRTLPADCRGRAVAGCDLGELAADVAACVLSYLETRALDPSRMRRLVECVGRLGRVVPQLEGEGRGYFERLQAMAGLLLHACQAGGPQAQGAPPTEVSRLNDLAR